MQDRKGGPDAGGRRDGGPLQMYEDRVKEIRSATGQPSVVQSKCSRTAIVAVRSTPCISITTRA